MKMFFEKNKTLADIILDNRITGKSLTVFSFGLAKKEIAKLITRFEKIILIIDTNAVKRTQKKSIVWVLALEKMTKKIKLMTCGRAHVKIAIVDEEVLIITSANLQKNRSEEFYSVERFDKIKHSCIINKIKTAIEVTSCQGGDRRNTRLIY